MKFRQRGVDLLVRERGAVDLLRSQTVVRAAEKPQILLVVASVQSKGQ